MTTLVGAIAIHHAGADHKERDRQADDQKRHYD
jgi:hypothetical protein